MLRLLILLGKFSKLCMKTQRQYKLQQLTTRFESIRMSEDLTTWKILQTMHEGTKVVQVAAVDY